MVYDSAYMKWDNQSLLPIMKQFWCQMSRICIVNGVQKQSGSEDCGLFAIAFATSIAFGQDPLKTTYTQSFMRKHLAD